MGNGTKGERSIKVAVNGRKMSGLKRGDNKSLFVSIMILLYFPLRNKLRKGNNTEMVKTEPVRYLLGQNRKKSSLGM